jgi:hypothetical protein
MRSPIETSELSLAKDADVSCHVLRTNLTLGAYFLFGSGTLDRAGKPYNRLGPQTDGGLKVPFSKETC